MSRKKYDLPKKTVNRISSIFFIFIIVYVFLIYRLIDIQYLKGDFYKQKAQNQSTEKIDLNSGRGIIYDRNGKPLTDVKKNKIIIVEKERLFNDESTKTVVKRATGLDEAQIYKNIEDQKYSSVVKLPIKTLDKTIEENLKEKNILVEEETLRYSPDGLMASTIGYVSGDNEGICGIEKSLDYLLKDSNERYVSAFRAGQSGNVGKDKVSILKGSVKTVIDNENNQNVKLTIDKDIQKIVENITKKEENPTSVVISDIKTGEILAMSSMPTFDPDNISKSIEENEKNNNGAFYNRAVQVTYPPGSVFKIVVLYAALEAGVVDENYTYTCTGKTNIGNTDEILKCHKLDGHGLESLQQVFSNSCNPAFLDIAMKVGKEKILIAAEKLHLGEEIDTGLEEEKTGSIPKDISIRNLAIGQGSMEFTPLEINQLTQIVSNNGSYKPLYLYDSIVDENKDIIKLFKQSKSSEIISPYTMTIIKEMMKNVSKEGTAKELKDLEGGSGVKTGTAQSSLSGAKITHGWITGFYPENNSKYAITIIVEGKEGKSKSAVPIFNEICKEINNK